MRRAFVLACVLALSAVGAYTANALPLDAPASYVMPFEHPEPGHRMPILQGVKAPAPVPHPQPIWGCLTSGEVASYARGAGFPESAIPTMVAIAYRESHWCTGAINKDGGACGLWQLYPCPGPEALNPATNAALAYAKYEASGLSPWGL